MTIKEQLAQLRANQIAHIKEHLEVFQSDKGEGRDVTNYFDDYWEPEDPDGLYQGLCGDLGIQPKPTCLDN